MKKLLGIVMILACVCGLGRADTWTYTIDAVTGKSYTSGVAVASGWLDRLEFSQETASTCTWQVATYDSANSKVIQLYGGKGNDTGDTTVIRPRGLGTSTNGTQITYVAASGTTNVLQQLVAQYEPMMIGGNTRVKITQGAVTGLTNTLKVTIFYVPLDK